MARKLLLDTHTLIWYLEGNPRLGTAAKAVMDDPGGEMVLPIIALAEALYIVDKGRTRIPTTSLLMQRVLGDTRIHIWPLTLGVLQESLTLGVIPEIHDRLILATGLHLQILGNEVALLTKDAQLTAAGLVSVVW